MEQCSGLVLVEKVMILVDIGHFFHISTNETLGLGSVNSQALLANIIFV